MTRTIGIPDQPPQDMVDDPYVSIRRSEYERLLRVDAQVNGNGLIARLIALSPHSFASVADVSGTRVHLRDRRSMFALEWKDSIVFVGPNGLRSLEPSTVTALEREAGWIECADLPVTVAPGDELWFAADLVDDGDRRPFPSEVAPNQFKIVRGPAREGFNGEKP